MKKLLLSFLLFALITFYSGCTAGQKTEHVLIETSYGNILIRLYDDTPLHRDNFIKLIKSGFYDGILFHRVINNFMIQGGDPNSKDAPPNTELGHGSPDYKIDAEILYPKYFHKKGAIAAARQGDNVNPQRQSSGSQFYIVQGQVITNEELDQIEQKFIYNESQRIMIKYLMPHRETLIKLHQEGNQEAIEAIYQNASLEAAGEIENIESFKISEDIRKIYTTIGGTPHLDGEYTVFGEVVEGLDVVDKIAKVETDEKARPNKNIPMNVKVVMK